MQENMERSFGLLFSQRVLLTLAEKGLPRQTAYEMVQRNAMRAWRERTAFRDLLAADAEVMARLTPGDLDACFDPSLVPAERRRHLPPRRASPEVGPA